MHALFFRGPQRRRPGVRMVASAALIVVILCGCGGGGGGPSGPPANQTTITPSGGSLTYQGATLQFSAGTVSQNTTVNITPVPPPTSNATLVSAAYDLTAQGQTTFSKPVVLQIDYDKNNIPAGYTATVVTISNGVATPVTSTVDLATAIAQSSIGHFSVWAVAAGKITVAVSPASANVAPGHTAPFTATATVAVNSSSGGTSVNGNGVSWSVQPGGAGGTIDQNGVYTAPATLGSAGTDTIIATSLADGTKTATATATVHLVTAPPGAPFDRAARGRGRF